MPDRIVCSCVTCPKCGTWVVVEREMTREANKEKVNAVCPAPECGKQFAFAGGDTKLRDSRVEETKYVVTEQEWYRGSDLWSTLTVHPTGERPAAAFAESIDIDGARAGVLAVIIELTRVSNFLSQLTVGKSAGAFILERDGSAIASPDPNADELTPLVVPGRGGRDPPGGQRL